MKTLTFKFDMSSAGLKITACAPGGGGTGDFPDVLERPDLAAIFDMLPQEPLQYKVFMHDDPTTPFDFAVRILQKHFGKTGEEATWIAMTTHLEGLGLVGVYSKEMAEHKVKMANEDSRSQKHPLLGTPIGLTLTCEPA